MLNYISAELYKVRRRKSTWLLLALLLCGECLYFLLFNHREYSLLLILFMDSLVVGLPLTMLLTAVVSSDTCQSGVLKNELSTGLSRGRIYLGKLFSALLVSLAALGLVVAVLLAAGLFFSHTDPAAERENLVILLYCLAAVLPMWMGALGLSQMLLFVIPSPGVAETIYFLWFFLGDWTFSLVNWSGDPMVGGMWRFLQPILLSWPFTQFQGQLTWGFLARNWLVGLGWLCATSAVGFFFFRRRELR